MAAGKYQKWLTEENLIRLEGWARDGLTDEQIAHNMGITRKTLYEWKDKYSDICNALKKGKEVVDLMVENALLKRALGYDWEEQRVEISPNGKKKGIQTTRHVPGDVTAQIIWLKNRRPDKWRDKPVAPEENRTEDSGLAAALRENVHELFEKGDDSEMVSNEE